MGMDDGFLSFVGRNFVGAIIMFSLLIWVPIAYLFHAADQKQVEIHAKQNLAFEGVATFAMMHPVGMLQNLGTAPEPPDDEQSPEVSVDGGGGSNSDISKVAENDEIEQSYLDQTSD